MNQLGFRVPFESISSYIFCLIFVNTIDVACLPLIRFLRAPAKEPYIISILMAKRPPPLNTRQKLFSCVRVLFSSSWCVYSSTWYSCILVSSSCLGARSEGRASGFFIEATKKHQLEPHLPSTKSQSQTPISVTICLRLRVCFSFTFLKPYRIPRLKTCAKQPAASTAHLVVQVLSSSSRPLPLASGPVSS